ncbi:ABC transporter family domain protein, partial [Escherichia coli 97.0007]
MVIAGDGQATLTGEELPATLTPGQQVMVSWSRD